MKRGLRSSRGIIAALAVAILTACAVGPDFRQPDAPNTDGYTPTPLPPATTSAPGTGGGTQRFVVGQEIPRQWWKLFRSEALDRLIHQALDDSPTLAAAQATLRAARENLSAETGAALFPSVDAALVASHQKISGAAFGQPNAPSTEFRLYNASVNVSYGLDLFGGARRGLEVLRSQVDFQKFQVEAAALALSANVITTAIAEASLRAQIRATLDNVAAQEKRVELVERQFQLGAVSQSDVLTQQTQLAQVRTGLAPLEKALAQTRHRLAVLTGKLPSEMNLPEFKLEELQLPLELPVSLPSALVRQRPDVRAAEALWHRASAEIGVATANMLPQLKLSASVGSQANRYSDLFDSGTGVWNLGAALLQPLFHGGQLSAKRRAAIANYDAAAAQYRETVLQAFQNVADVLRALELDAVALKAQVDAEAAAGLTLALTQKQLELGAVSYLSVLDAERQYQQARVGLVQAQAIRYTDTAALFQALGGGWWNSVTPTENATDTNSPPTPADPNIRTEK